MQCLGEGYSEICRHLEMAEKELDVPGFYKIPSRLLCYFQGFIFTVFTLNHFTLNPKKIILI